MNKTTSESILRVHRIFKEKGFSLSSAESCTGGLISHYITAFPGAGLFYIAGVVAYSPEMKKQLLGVSSAVIENYGVVSAQTAKEMAEKIREITGSDFSVSTTGNLGPDALEGKGKGLVYIAVSKKGQTLSRELRLKGNRGENKESAALEALQFLIGVAGEGYGG